MNNPPEKPSRPETNLTPAENEPASAAVPADFAKRLKQFEAETRRRKISRKRKFGVIGGVALMNILFLTFVVLRHEPAGMLLSGFNILVDAAFLYNALASARAAALTDAVMRSVEECGPQAIGPILARLDAFPSSKEKALLWQALVRLLQRIQPDEAEAMPRDVRDRFNRRLSNTMQVEGCAAEDVEFCLAWLKVQEQIGGARDLRVVESLTETRTQNPFYRKIRRAALDCLPLIEARIAAQEPGRTLLRASASPPDSGKTLLRPAPPSNPTAPNELLRPVEPEEDAPPA